MHNVISSSVQYVYTWHVDSAEVKLKMNTHKLVVKQYVYSGCAILTSISSCVVIPGLPLELSLDDITPGSGLHLEIIKSNYQDSILVICLHFIVGT